MRYEDDINTAQQVEINMPRVRVRWGAANFARYIWRSRLLSRSEENENVVTDLMQQCGHCLHKEGGSVVKVLWNALRGRHKYGATNGNQYAARRCSMITRLTRNSLTRVRVRWGAAIFAHYNSIFNICNKCVIHNLYTSIVRVHVQLVYRRDESM